MAYPYRLRGLLVDVSASRETSIERARGVAAAAHPSRAWHRRSCDIRHRAMQTVSGLSPVLTDAADLN